MSIRREILPSQETSSDKEVQSSSSDGVDKVVSPSDSEAQSGEVKDPNTSSSSDGVDKNISSSQEDSEVKDPNAEDMEDDAEEDKYNIGSTKTVIIGDKRPRSEVEDEEEDERPLNEEKKTKLENNKGMLIS